MASSYLDENFNRIDLKYNEEVKLVNDEINSKIHDIHSKHQNYGVETGWMSIGKYIGLWIIICFIYYIIAGPWYGIFVCWLPGIVIGIISYFIVKVYRSFNESSMIRDANAKSSNLENDRKRKIEEIEKRRLKEKENFKSEFKSRCNYYRDYYLNRNIDSLINEFALFINQGMNKADKRQHIQIIEMTFKFIVNTDGIISMLTFDDRTENKGFSFTEKRIAHLNTIENRIGFAEVFTKKLGKKVFNEFSSSQFVSKPQIKVEHDDMSVVMTIKAYNNNFKHVRIL